MSNTNQSNPGTTQSNNQEIPVNQTGLSLGSSNPVTNSIRNGTVQQAQTATVFLVSANGGSFTVTPDTLCVALAQQHQVFKRFEQQVPLDPSKPGDDVTILVRKVDVWSSGDTFLTCKFHMGGRSPEQVVETKQFYAIGFAGAERNHISFDYDVVTHVIPWDVKNRINDPIFDVSVANGSGSPAGFGYFAQITFTFYNRTFLNFISNPFLLNFPDEQTCRKRRAESDAEMHVAKIKKLTIPVNAE